MSYIIMLMLWPTGAGRLGRKGASGAFRICCQLEHDGYGAWFHCTGTGEGGGLVIRLMFLAVCVWDVCGCVLSSAS